MGKGNQHGTADGSNEATVFVSYSREDQKRALPIIKILENAGFSVWWDGLLEGGERFARTTEAALENAKAVVVLWSTTSHDSHWVHDEATRGRDRKCLVPLSIDGSEAPLGFRQFQLIDAAQGKVKDGSPEMQKMVRAVAALHDRPSDFFGAAVATSPALNRRHLLIGGGTAALGAVGLAAWLAGLVGGSSANAASVAVMPFENLSGDPKQAYFSDGLAAEVRAELSRNALLQVAAQTSSNTFRDRQDDIKTIASKLGVAFLLEGSVRRSGDMVKIDAQLINGRTGFESWSESFDRSMTDIFAVQNEIATAIATKLSDQIGSGSPAKSDTEVSGGTKSVAAFDAYLRGRDLFDAGADEASDRLAVAKFDEAIAADPKYAAAYAAKSRSLAVIANQYGAGEELRTLYNEAVLAARRAVEVAPKYAEAHSALGFALAVGKMDMRSARAPYEMSLKLGSGDADILSRYAIFASRFGRFAEADNAITKSLALDPLNARTFRVNGAINYGVGRYEKAVEELEKGLKLSPTLGAVRAGIGHALLMQGDIAAAQKSFEAEKNTLFGLPGIAIIAHRQGNKAAAQAALDQLVAEHGDNGLYQQAQIYAQWGEADKAIAALLAARAAGDAGLIQLYNDPMLEPVRKRPEFSRLLKDIGFV